MPILFDGVIDLAEEGAIGRNVSQDLDIFKMEGGGIGVGEKQAYRKLGFQV